VTARWGQRLLLAGGILAFWPGSPRPYYAAKSLCAAAGLAWAWLCLPRARRAALPAPVLALLAVAAVSAALGADPGRSFWGDALQPYYGLLQLWLYALAFALGACASDELLEDGLDALRAAAVGCGAAAAAQAAGLIPQPWANMAGRMLGPTGNPVFFGALCALLLPPSLAGAGRAGGWRRAAPVGALLGLLLARSRGAWLAAAAGAALYAAFSGRLAGRGRQAAAGLAAASLAAALWLAGPEKARSDLLRVETWRVAAATARERPLLGYGPDAFMLAFRRHQSDAYAAAAHETGQGQTSAHDDLLQAAATMGLLGLGAYLWLLAALAWDARRTLAGPRAPLGAAAAGGLLALFVAAKFNPVPLEACAAAAWLAGALRPRGEPAGPEAGPVLTGAALAVLAAFLALAGADAARASSRSALERGDLALGVTRARLALTLTPGRPASLQALGEALATAAANLPRERALPYAAEGLELGRDASRRHAGDPAAHELAGTLALADAKATGDKERLTEARAELERASELDPHHTYAVERRLEIARMLGDKDAEARETRRLEELKALLAL
jgi:O-antigen ligase